MIEKHSGWQDRLALVDNPIQEILPQVAPAYFTEKGAMYCGDARDLLRCLPTDSVNLVMTSPPYPLVFKKEYDNVDEDKYVSWLLTFVSEIRRVLRKDGSFVLNLGGVWRKGSPVRSLVHYQVAMEISKVFQELLAQAHPQNLLEPTVNVAEDTERLLKATQGMRLHAPHGDGESESEHYDFR